MGELATAIDLLVSLTNAATAALVQASQISAIIQKANAESRTTLTPEEWAAVDAMNSASKQALVDAIQKALAKS